MGPWSPGSLFIPTLFAGQKVSAVMLFFAMVFINQIMTNLGILGYLLFTQ